MWFLRTDRVYASYNIRTDLPLDNGVYMLDIGAIRQTVEEARRDAELASGDISNPPPSTAAESGAGSTDSDFGNSVKKEDMVELGSTTHKIPQQQESVWGYCAVAELVLQNRTAYVGVCVYCDVVLTSGPARGSRSSAETDAFMMVSDVLASGISYAATSYVMPSPNPAEDIFLTAPQETSVVDDVTVDDFDVKQEDGEDVEAPETTSSYEEGGASSQEEVAPIETPTGDATIGQLDDSL
jgi:hypothetical protein